MHFTGKQQDMPDRLEACSSKYLIDLASRSIPENTKRKAMWAYRMYEAWSEWRRDINENEREKSSVVKNILTLYLELHYDGRR